MAAVKAPITFGLPPGVTLRGGVVWLDGVPLPAAQCRVCGTVVAGEGARHACRTADLNDPPTR